MKWLSLTPLLGLVLGCEYMAFDRGPTSTVQIIGGSYAGSTLLVDHHYFAQGVVRENDNIDLVEGVSVNERGYFDGNFGIIVPVSFSAEIGEEVYDSVRCYLNLTAALETGSMDT